MRYKLDLHPLAAFWVMITVGLFALFWMLAAGVPIAAWLAYFVVAAWLAMLASALFGAWGFAAVFLLAVSFAFII